MIVGWYSWEREINIVGNYLSLQLFTSKNININKCLSQQILTYNYVRRKEINSKFSFSYENIVESKQT